MATPLIGDGTFLQDADDELLTWLQNDSHTGNAGTVEAALEACGATYYANPHDIPEGGHVASVPLVYVWSYGLEWVSIESGTHRVEVKTRVRVFAGGTSAGDMKSACIQARKIAQLIGSLVKLKDCPGIGGWDDTANDGNILELSTSDLTTIPYDSEDDNLALIDVLFTWGHYENT